MRDRLIELIEDTLQEWECDVSKKTISEIADHLLANGVIVPPCKVGDTVYEIAKNCLACIHYTDGGYSDFCECTLDDDKSMFECDFDKECIYLISPEQFNYGMLGSFGKTVFLAREEAEQALKGGGEG